MDKRLDGRKNQRSTALNSMEQSMGGKDSMREEALRNPSYCPTWGRGGRGKRIEMASKGYT